MFKSILNPVFKVHISVNSILNKDKCICLNTFVKKHSFFIRNTNLRKSNYSTNINLQIKPLMTTGINLQKIFMEGENAYAYSILKTIPLYDSKNLDISIGNKMDEVEFEQILQKNYRKETATNIFQTFQLVLSYCIENKISISDERFNNLVDGLMDKCQDLNDKELSDLLETLIKYPPVESYQSHNFHDVWSALDDMCRLRLKTWNTTEQLKFADHWYNLHLGRLSDYIYDFLNVLPRRTGKLSADELVYAFFYLNITRKGAIPFEFEDQLSKHIDTLTIDQLAIVSMGYFKTKSKIKIPIVIEKIIDKVIQETSTIHEISLTAILKIIRYTPNVKLSNKLVILLDKLLPEIDRLSVLCCIHIALLGTNIQLFHPASLKKISDKLLKNIDVVRLKDLERMLLALSLYNYDPETKPICIYKAISQQLNKLEREIEYKQYPRCLPCSLHYLSIRKIFPDALISKVLDEKFIHETYGNKSINVGRELFMLDRSIEIEHPNYIGNRLKKNEINKIAKWKTEYFPNREYSKKWSAAEKLMLQIWDCIIDVTEGKQFVLCEHVLPHFPRADLIVCKNKNGQFQIPTGFEKYKLGDIMYPNNKDVTWYAFVVISWNNIIRNTSIPLGSIDMKIRQLEKIGYKPILIMYNDFVVMNPIERKQYVLNSLK